MSAPRLAWLGLVLLLPLDARGEGPTGADLDLAKAHYRTGELDYERGSFPDAAKEFEEAYRLSGRPELIYNMGKSYDGAGDLRGALKAYRRFLGAVQASPDRPFAERRVDELQILIAHLELRASVPGASVTLDGTRLGATPLAEPIVEVNPGDHAVEIAAEGYATFRKAVHLGRAQTEKIDAQLVSLVQVIHVADRPKAVPIYKRWYLWAAVGIVVAAGVVTGAVLGTRAAGDISEPHLQLPKVQAP